MAPGRNGAAPAEGVSFAVERVRIDEADGHCLIAGADDEEEPAGYFIVEIDATGLSVEFLGEELTQRDGVVALEIGPHHLAFTLDPRSPVGRAMPVVRITSGEAIGPAVRDRLTAALGPRARLV
ncbi:hypothetical protein [Methylobacterium planeticum]|uniref:Uncharacterized protein n=1 Tax=Methylobacterium planeticum TaxID=2615211 RepID=A0A6N6MRT7_9HYPH|nr:hypothetical protein [Methylobacterium planeticum]KAB1073030.1 hypothetical protein F6X51_13700 [Methylobacterium planeticum]